MEYLELGQHGIINGIEVVAVKAKDYNTMACKKCVFFPKCNGGYKKRPKCFATERPDRESVKYILYRK